MIAGTYILSGVLLVDHRVPVQGAHVRRVAA